MFNFFVKKQFLADYLENFVDIHNHILPGIDDGAKTAEDSLEIIRGFSDLGVKSFVATPHIMHNYYPNTSETIKEALSGLKNAMMEAGLNEVAIDTAAEHMVDDNFETLLEEGTIMPLRKDYLLVEMSFLQPPINFDQSIIDIAAKRYFPILAHPERYIFLQKRMGKYKSYKRKGILFQMNMLSLGEYYGKDVQQTAYKLLDEELIDYLGSDVHNIQQLHALREIRISRKYIARLLPVLERTISSFY